MAGDVGPKSGNVMFLGSVHVGGSVLDNYEVKAAGNVEVRGSVQKAKIEGEGDIIIQSGIMGRDEAVVESTGGSVIAKFIQSAKILAAQDITVQESILHSHVEAGNEIVCSGRRADRRRRDSGDERGARSHYRLAGLHGDSDHRRHRSAHPASIRGSDAHGDRDRHRTERKAEGEVDA